MQQKSKDNHYVPQLYLKQWAHKNEILTYRLLVPNSNVPMWKKHSLKGIAFHQHLYTYMVGQDEADEFERWLNTDFENPAKEAIQLAIDDKRLSPEHWKRLVRFAMALDVRTPARLNEFIVRQSTTMPTLLNETVDRSISKLEQAVHDGKPLPENLTNGDNVFPLKVSIEKQPDGSGKMKAEATIGRRLWIWQMKHLLTKTLKKVSPHKWTILHAPVGMSWPTSDNPLVRLNFKDSEHYDFLGGWDVKNGDILLPLSPRHLLYTCIGQRPWQRGTTLDMKTTQLIQKIIIEHADRYIFAQCQSDIHLIRPRLVCLETFNNEKAMWQRWHSEQCQAER